MTSSSWIDQPCYVITAMDWTGTSNGVNLHVASMNYPMRLGTWLPWCDKSLALDIAQGWADQHLMGETWDWGKSGVKLTPVADSVASDTMKHREQTSGFKLGDYEDLFRLLYIRKPTRKKSIWEQLGPLAGRLLTKDFIFKALTEWRVSHLPDADPLFAEVEPEEDTIRECAATIQNLTDEEQALLDTVQQSDFIHYPTVSLSDVARGRGAHRLYLIVSQKLGKGYEHIYVGAYEWSMGFAPLVPGDYTDMPPYVLQSNWATQRGAYLCNLCMSDILKVYEHDQANYPSVLPRLSGYWKPCEPVVEVFGMVNPDDVRGARRPLRAPEEEERSVPIYHCDPRQERPFVVSCTDKNGELIIY